MANETTLPEQTLLTFAVRAGPPEDVLLKMERKTVSCNNTSKRMALSAAELKLIDAHGNLTGAPAGSRLRVHASYVHVDERAAAGSGRTG